MKKIASFHPKGSSEFKAFSNKDRYKYLYDNPYWVRYSREFLANNNKCYRCGSKSEVTDHIEPHKGNPRKFWNEENYIPLCSRCHNQATAKFEMKWLGEESLKEKLSWISKNRRVNQLSSRVMLLPIPKEVLRDESLFPRISCEPS